DDPGQRRSAIRRPSWPASPGRSTRSTSDPELAAGDWPSASEAGAWVGVRARTVGRWIRSGRLRGRVTEGGQFRVTREEVERLAAAQERRATQGPPPHKEERTPPQS